MKNFSLIQKLRNRIKIDDSSVVELDKNIKLVSSTISIKGKNNTLIIEDGTVIRNTTIEIIGTNCIIHIGKNCMIGDNSYLVAKEEGIKLIIGNDCALSRNVKVMTSDGHPIYQESIRINQADNIVIESDVWIADSVTILKGVILGKGSVVGINSLVTKSAPSNCIIAGNPAKIVKENITWKDKDV